MTLLHAHIRNQMPSAFVATQHSWKLMESEWVVERRLRKIDPAFPRQSITFLLLPRHFVLQLWQPVFSTRGL